MTPDSATGQISPGPLAKPHANLDQALSCLKCHGAGSKSLDQLCLNCHEAIAWTVERGRGLHGHLSKLECARCHPDHVGRDFNLINWEEGSPERFDHLRAGFALEGKHAPLKCRDCHKPEFQKKEVMKLLKSKRPAQSWMGLEPACIGCHEDVHQGSLDPDCATCHDANGWKPARRFDHAKSDFPLTGKHADVDCNKCHLAPGVATLVDKSGRRRPRYKPLPHKECVDCHKDPHAGRAGNACSRCHVTTSFKEIDRKKFDHNLTRYPLRGRHARVECAQCHDPEKAWGKRPTFGTCDACHSDPHAGKATLAGKRVDCASCHRVEGWKPSTYTVKQHDASGYPLKGKHRQVKCDACHAKNPRGIPASVLGRAGVLIRPRFRKCRNCHHDAHAGQLANRADKGACEACHRVEGWTPSTYPAAEHAKLKLPLKGRHAKVKCAACHGPVRTGLPPLPGQKVLGSASVSLTHLSSECRACHFDPHRGRFSRGGERAKRRDCLTCHDVSAFHPARVDVETHRYSRFPLDGAHRAIPCFECHKELRTPAPRIKLLAITGNPRPLTFVEKEKWCKDCHESPHGKQFEGRPGKGACGACHDADSFKPASRFDHQQHARFRLDGAHIKVKCDRCHPTRKLRGGKRQIVYRPLDWKCESCHKPGELRGRSRRPARAG